jgi:DNA-binding protein
VRLNSLHYPFTTTFPFGFNHLVIQLQSPVLGFGCMKKRELAERVAELQGLAPAEAADQVDKAVHKIIRALKSGQSARLPGLGTIMPDLGAPGRRWLFKRDSDER